LSSSDVLSSSFLGGLRFNHQNGINAATAVCTWHSVSSGFFPPKFLSHSREEQVTHTAQDQVAFQPPVPPSLVLVQPDLTLLVLEAPLHWPAREGHQQHRRDSRPLGCVAHEELPLVGVQDVAGDNQVHRLVLEIESNPVYTQDFDFFDFEPGVVQSPDAEQQ
jgi:hypothetical protein